MRALVTGGAGFIGSYICERLVGEGVFVHCIDNLHTGRLENVDHLLGRKNFDFVRHDVTSPLPPFEVQEVWNFACPASPPKYQEDPIHTMKTCVLGALNALELARHQRARFIQASTSEVYGDPEVHPQTECYRGSVNPNGPRACYDEGKRAAETLCFDYWRRYGIRLKVARIFNTYGPRMDCADGRVVTNFIVQALTRRPLEIYGDGQQTRSFCYIDDLIEGLFRLMRSPDHVTGPINLGNPVEYTVDQLADLVLAMTCSDAPIIHTSLPQDDPRQRRPDTTLAERLLSWRPTRSLKEGLAPTIEFMTRELAAMEVPSPIVAAYSN